MNGPDHYREAERLLRTAGGMDKDPTVNLLSPNAAQAVMGNLLAAAQVHATLALAAAQAHVAVELASARGADLRGSSWVEAVR